jgi:hypothetical protein
MSLVYLYSYSLPVQLSETNQGAPNYSRPMYNYNIKVYKNNHNTVDFVVRNNDNKPVRLIDSVINVVIQNVQTGQTVLEKAAFITDEIKGRAQLALRPDDTSSWQLGNYRFSVSLVRPSQGGQFLFVDVTNNVAGMFELLPSIGRELVPSTSILFEEFTPVMTDWYDRSTRYITGALQARTPTGAASSFYSIAVYTVGWSGTFQVQASLQNLSPTEESWFTVDLLPNQSLVRFDDESPNVVPFNLQLNAQWLRFLVQPSLDNQGKFVKVLYKIN